MKIDIPAINIDTGAHNNALGKLFDSLEKILGVAFRFFERLISFVIDFMFKALKGR